VAPTTIEAVPLAERVSLAFKRSGFRSLRAWSSAAGLSEGYAEHVASGRRGKRPNAEHLRKLAEAAKVDPQWLMTGVGSPDREPPSTRLVVYDDPYPSRAPVLAMAKVKKVDAAAIAALEAERLKESDGDPGEEYWRVRLRHYLAESRKLDREMRADPEDTAFKSSIRSR
jgi:transcriptional regulator with XRE-family HTH domain